eukprot:g8420.t1
MQLDEKWAPEGEQRSLDALIVAVNQHTNDSWALNAWFGLRDCSVWNWAGASTRQRTMWLGLPPCSN